MIQPFVVSAAYELHPIRCSRFTCVLARTLVVFRARVKFVASASIDFRREPRRPGREPVRRRRNHGDDGAVIT